MYKTQSKERLYQAKYYQERKLKYRKAIFEVLSNYDQEKLKCQECGYSDKRALEVDHIENNGSSHHKRLGGLGYYKSLYKMSRMFDEHLAVKYSNLIYKLPPYFER